MNKNINLVISYTIAFVLVQIILNYVLHLPQRITGEKELVNQYYYDDYKFTIPLDYVLIIGYLLVAYVPMHLMEINDFATQLCFVILVTIAISGSFAYYFQSQPESDNFFSKIFHRSKYRLVVNDMIIVTLTFIMFMIIHEGISA